MIITPLAISFMSKYSDHLFRRVCVATYQQSGSERFHIDNSFIIVFNLRMTWALYQRKSNIVMSPLKELLARLYRSFDVTQCQWLVTASSCRQLKLSKLIYYSLNLHFFPKTWTERKYWTERKVKQLLFFNLCAEYNFLPPSW